MKTVIILFTCIIIILSFISSLMGMLSFSDDEYAAHVTARGESVEILQEGFYKYNFKAMVGEGIAWDAVRVFFAVPILIITFIKPTQMRFAGRL